MQSLQHFIQKKKMDSPLIERLSAFK